MVWPDVVVEDYAEHSAEQRRWWQSQDGQQPGDPDKLAAVQKYERKLAVAELPCRAEYQAAYEKVSAEYEQEFIDNNKSTLDEVKAEVVG